MLAIKIKHFIIIFHWNSFCLLCILILMSLSHVFCILKFSLKKFRLNGKLHLVPEEQWGNLFTIKTGGIIFIKLASLSQPFKGVKNGPYDSPKVPIHFLYLPDEPQARNQKRSACTLWNFKFNIENLYAKMQIFSQL